MEPLLLPIPAQGRGGSERKGVSAGFSRLPEHSACARQSSFRPIERVGGGAALTCRKPNGLEIPAMSVKIN
jgi:hypothetical protein